MLVLLQSFKVKNNKSDVRKKMRSGEISLQEVCFSSVYVFVEKAYVWGLVENVPLHRQLT
jgi:hypothetical protein